MRRLESRLERLEAAAPKEATTRLLVVEVQEQPELTEPEKDVLRAEQERRLAEARANGLDLVVMVWSHEEARRLGAPSPSRQAIRVVVELPDGEMPKQVTYGLA